MEMRFIRWKLPSFSKQGHGIFVDRSSTLTLLLVYITMCLMSPVQGSCKNLVSSNGKGHQSAQQMRQYINCMRLVENSYFKRSGRGSYPEQIASDPPDEISDIFSNQVQPFVLDRDSNLGSVKDEFLGTTRPQRSDEDKSNWFGLLLLNKPYNFLKLLKQRNDHDQQEFYKDFTRDSGVLDY